MQRNQTTLSQEVTFKGRGVHSGLPCDLTCTPIKENRFLFSADLNGTQAEWQLGDGLLTHQDRSTALMAPSGELRTIEHFMAACYALGLNSIHAHCSASEMPFLDGSAMSFYSELKNNCIQIDILRPKLVIKEPLFVSEGSASILALPAESLRITYTLDQEHTLLKGRTVTLDTCDIKRLEEVLESRTFCTKDEAERLLTAGYGKGADNDNTLVMDVGGPVKTQLRYPEECAQHKVLDFIGDMALLNVDLSMQIVAIRSGHGLNAALRELIKEEGIIQNDG